MTGDIEEQSQLSVCRRKRASAARGETRRVAVATVDNMSSFLSAHYSHFKVTLHTVHLRLFPAY